MKTGGFIYAIGAVGTSYVKIGRTTGPVTKRLAILQIGHPEPLTLRASVPVERDLSQIEKAIHRFLEVDRQRGEWFAVEVDQAQLEALIVRAMQWIAEQDAPQENAKGGRMAESLGDRIRIERARLRMSQVELAGRVGISPTAMNAIESGSVDPRASRIKKLAEALGVTTDYLLGHGKKEEQRRPVALALVGT